MAMEFICKGLDQETRERVLSCALYNVKEYFSYLKYDWSKFADDVGMAIGKMVTEDEVARYRDDNGDYVKPTDWGIDFKNGDISKLRKMYEKYFSKNKDICFFINEYFACEINEDGFVFDFMDFLELTCWDYDDVKEILEVGRRVHELWPETEIKAKGIIWFDSGYQLLHYEIVARPYEEYLVNIPITCPICGNTMYERQAYFKGDIFEEGDIICCRQCCQKFLDACDREKGKVFNELKKICKEINDIPEWSGEENMGEFLKKWKSDGGVYNRIKVKLKKEK